MDEGAVQITSCVRRFARRERSARFDRTTDGSAEDFWRHVQHNCAFGDGIHIVDIAKVIQMLRSVDDKQHPRGLLTAKFKSAASFFDATVAEVLTDIERGGEALASKLAFAQAQVGETTKVETICLSPSILTVRLL